MSARDWRAVREGETHSAARTSSSNTPESLIVGVGASGALLAGAAIVFITLVGLVSFNVWPSARDTSAVESVELQAAANGASNGTGTPVSEASGQLASTGPASAGSSSAGGGGGDGGGGGADRGDGKRGGSEQPPPAATTPVTPPSSGDTGEGGSGGSGNDNGGGDSNGGESKTPPSSAGKDTGGDKTAPGQADRGGSNSGKSKGGGSKGWSRGSKGDGRGKATNTVPAPSPASNRTDGSSDKPDNGNGRSDK